MHTHTTTGIAVACLKEGLSPHNFYAAMLHGRVAYHDFEGITVEPGEKERLVRDLGGKPAVILRNHGLLAWGPSVPEAFLMLWTLQRACDVQIAASAGGRDPPDPGGRVPADRARIRARGEAHLRGRVRRPAAPASMRCDPSYRD